MKFLYDFFPLMAFYAAYQIYDKDIFIATGVLIVATIIQVSYGWFKHRKVEKMHIITMLLVTVFGGITILLHDPLYIKWKVSIVNWLFALVFIGSHFIGDKTIVERMLTNALTVTPDVWNKLNISWAGFFIAMGLLNVYVFMNYADEIWVDFKVFGMLGLTFVFVVLQGIYLSRHIKDEQTDSESE